MNNHDLFNNPMTDAAIKALSPEDRERYRKMGESMYGDVDHASVIQPGQATDPPLKQAAACIIAAIKSGLHPSYLDANEQAVLEDQIGVDWYTKFGYIKEDLTEIVTHKF